MTHLALEASKTQQRHDIESLTQRLEALAREMEEAGLPWAASSTRNVAGIVAAERQVAERLAA